MGPLAALIQASAIALTLAGPPQALCNRLDLFRLLLADEFQSNMQRLRPDPARLGRKAADSIEKTRDLSADFLVEIDTDKNSHE